MTLKPSLLLALLAVTFFATARFPVANAFGWNPGPTKVPMGESLSPDPKLKFVDAAPAIGKALNVDSHFKFVDTNSNNNWVTLSNGASDGKWYKQKAWTSSAQRALVADAIYWLLEVQEIGRAHV